MGAERDDVVLTTSPAKEEDARSLGAHALDSRNPRRMKKLSVSFDFILDTVSAAHDFNAYLNLLGVDGDLRSSVRPRAPRYRRVQPDHAADAPLRFAIGGIAETQETLDFCGKHNITADVEVIPIQKVNEAYERLLKSDCDYFDSIWLHSNPSDQFGRVGGNK